jgi:hypothetical protein
LKALGWRPATDLRQVARAYLAWLRSLEGIANHTEEALDRMRRLGLVRRVE